MTILLIAPHRVAQSWLLRWALYSGAILSAQYTLIQAIAIADPSAPLSLGTFLALIAAVIATLLSLGALWIVPRIPRIKLAYWLPCAILIPFAAAFAWRITLPFIFLCMMLVAITAPRRDAGSLSASLLHRPQTRPTGSARKYPLTPTYPRRLAHHIRLRLGARIHERIRSLQLHAKNHSRLLTPPLPPILPPFSDPQPVAKNSLTDPNNFR